MSIYHIIGHTLEPFFKDVYFDVNNVKNLDHAVNKFIKTLTPFDSHNEHILVCLSSRISSHKIELTHKDGYKIIVLKSYYLFYPLEISIELIKFIIGLDKADIIHIHGVSSFIYDSITPFLIGKKSIAHYRGGHFTWKSFPLSFIKYCLFFPLSLRIPQFVIVENKIRLEKYKKYYFLPNKKLVYIPGFLELPEVSIHDIKNRSDFKILFVGRLEKAKGILDLIDTFEKLGVQYKDMCLSIAGDGSLKNFIVEKVKNTDKIKYLGFLSQPDLMQQYKDSDILVLPTYFDSFGLVLIEAMGNFLPVISTFTEGPSDVIQDSENGFLVPPGDRDALYKKIEILYKNPSLRKKFAEKGYENLKNNFSVEKNIEKVLYIYDSLSSKDDNMKRGV